MANNSPKSQKMEQKAAQIYGCSQQVYNLLSGLKTVQDVPNVLRVVCFLIHVLYFTKTYFSLRLAYETPVLIMFLKICSSEFLRE